MGACCGEIQGTFKHEKVIIDIFVNNSIFSKHDYKSFEALLKKNSEDKKIISKKVLLKLVCPWGTTEDSDGYKEILVRYFHQIFPNDEIPIYDILLILIPLLQDSNITVVQHFYYTLHSLNDNFKHLFYSHFKELLARYLKSNILSTTLLVCNCRELLVGGDKKAVEELATLKDKIYNETNLSNYIDKILFGFEVNNKVDSSRKISLDDIKEIFFNKLFVFDFIELRKNYLEDYYLNCGSE